MARKRHTPEQIIRMLREAEVELAKGQHQLRLRVAGLRSTQPQ
jgi:hypothetical protein